MLGHAKQSSSHRHKCVPTILPLRTEWDGSLLQDPTPLNPHPQFVFISIFFNLPQLLAMNHLNTKYCKPNTGS